MIFTEIIESIKLSFSSLRTNKLRSFLASLGVVIGISVVIMMGWALSGLDSAMKETFSIIGTDMIYIDKWDWTGTRNWKEIRNRKNISYSEVKKMVEKNSMAENVIPNINQWGVSINHKGETYKGMTVVGTTAENAKTPVGNMLEGRYFNEFEEETGTNVIVIGHTVYKTMFPNGNAIDKEIKIKGHKFRIIGVVQKRGTAFFDFIDRQTFIPIKKFAKIWNINSKSFSIGVKAGSEGRLERIRDESIGLMRVIRNLKPWEGNDFSINETKAFERSIREIRIRIWNVGIGMTLLSFFVGIIGIMNIMFVSVTERTKEIGIRKSLGAKKRSIWIQFLVEAAVLSFLGAIIALIFSSLFAFLIGTYIPNYVEELSFLKPYLPMKLFVIATVVSTIVGLFAGLIPAIRAANLDPVNALRFE